MKNFLTPLILAAIILLLGVASTFLPNFSKQLSERSSVQVTEKANIGPGLLNGIAAGTETTWRLALRLFNFLASGQWQYKAELSGGQAILLDQAKQMPGYLKEDLDSFSKFLEHQSTASSTHN